ncbi:hypothetical protein BDN72DRAFT_845197 [Pluteus cervinus]|uniref:Uncharacterized protein n=1 Tax=Pluteus cervinus TaxID=181527 RepID=A0ACD3AJI0_9AGAR|nr:hypothetical protein BDN72DRAFT_845197 [Pluteus cervinus]
MHPRLPPELERIVFTHALRNRVQDTTNLFLVAKRVHEWLFPVAFEVVHVGGSRFFPRKFTIDQFRTYGHYIHHLFVELDTELPTSGDFSLNKCLELCPNNIIFLMSPTTGDTLEESAFTKTTQDHSPLFPNVTHLNTVRIIYGLLDYSQDDLKPLFSGLPNLTHIALRYPRGGQVANLKLVLKKWKKLEAVILKCSWDETTTFPVDDDRIVLIRLEEQSDWVAAARGKVLSIWEFGDDVLVKRAEEKAGGWMEEMR